MILAHQAVAPSELARTWTFEPGVLAAVVVAGVVYWQGGGRGWRAAAFYGGLVVVAAALLSPVDAAASSLFAGHMVQHLLLMVVAAPLLACARPAANLLRGLPAPVRGRVPRVPGLMHPVVVWTLGTLALWAWHMPALYEAALRHEALHAAEHVSFLATALLFWAVVLGPRLARPLALVLVFATGVQSTALGAVLVFATTPLYEAHAVGARLWDVTLLHDQQLAGALMWGPPALLYLVTMAWLLLRWFGEMDRSAAEPSLVPAGDVA